MDIGRVMADDVDMKHVILMAAYLLVWTLAAAAVLLAIVLAVDNSWLTGMPGLFTAPFLDSGRRRADSMARKRRRSYAPSPCRPVVSTNGGAFVEIEAAYGSPNSCQGRRAARVLS
jgi:hypothetical protein